MRATPSLGGDLACLYGDRFVQIEKVRLSQRCKIALRGEGGRCPVCHRAGRSEIDAALRFDARVEWMLYFGHLGHQIGVVTQLWLGIAAR